MSKQKIEKARLKSQQMVNAKEITPDARVMTFVYLWLGTTEVHFGATAQQAVERWLSELDKEAERAGVNTEEAAAEHARVYAAKRNGVRITRTKAGEPAEVRYARDFAAKRNQQAARARRGK